MKIKGLREFSEVVIIIVFSPLWLIVTIINAIKEGLND